MKRESITQKDIAELAGVSSTVVSYVINEGPRPVAEETKRRVMNAIKELGYRPNKYAQRLRAKSTKALRQLGIILGGGSEILRRPYYGDIISGIYEEAYRQGQHIRFVHFFDELHDPLLLNSHVHQEEISAIIFFPLYSALKDPKNHALFMRIIERIPIIVCLEKAVADLPAVIFDRVGAARTAVEHLIGLGHRRIGFIGGKGERIVGYRQALSEHDVPYDEAIIIHPGPKNSPGEGYEAALQLLALDEPPTAVFAVCDEVAIGAIGAFTDRGVAVPQQMAITSIDDLDLAVIVRPALTTVHVPRREMGVQALRMIAMQEAYPDSPPSSNVLRTELIIRDSCGAKLRERRS